MMSARKLKYCLGIALILSGSFSATAQEGRGPKWSLGGMGLVYKSPFKSENTNPDGGESYNYAAFPYVAYRGDKLFIEGLQAGYHVLRTGDKNASFYMDALVSARPGARASGSNMAGDVGVRAGVNSAFGNFGVTLLQGVVGGNDGMEVIGSYGYRFGGRKLSFSPNVGIVWQSNKLANHLWGVSQEQYDERLSAGRTALPVYQVQGSAVNLYAGVTITYNFSPKWTMIAFTNVTRLDKKIKANPDINKGTTHSVGLGLAYNF